MLKYQRKGVYVDDNQKLVVEFEGPEEKIQKLLETLEEMIEKDENIQIKAVTIRND